MRAAGADRLAETSQDDETEDIPPADTAQKVRTARKRSHDVDQDKDRSVEPGPEDGLAGEAITERSASDAEQSSSAPTLVLPLDQAEELFSGA